MLLAITAWEVLDRGRPPVLATLTMIAFQLTVHTVAPHQPATTLNTVYLAWTIPLAIYLAVSWLGLGRAPALRPRRATPC
jgi:hypothetical protein